MKKKILAVLLTFAMTATLFAGCGGSSDAPATNNDVPASTESAGTAGTESNVKVSVFWYDESDVYLSTVRTELNEELDALGV